MKSHGRNLHLRLVSMFRDELPAWAFISHFVFSRGGGTGMTERHLKMFLSSFSSLTLLLSIFSSFFSFSFSTTFLPPLPSHLELWLSHLVEQESLIIVGRKLPWAQLTSQKTTTSKENKWTHFYLSPKTQWQSVHLCCHCITFTHSQLMFVFFSTWLNTKIC